MFKKLNMAQTIPQLQLPICRWAFKRN